MICPNCGREAKAAFCAYCGTKLPSAAPAPTASGSKNLFHAPTDDFGSGPAPSAPSFPAAPSGPAAPSRPAPAFKPASGFSPAAPALGYNPPEPPGYNPPEPSGYTTPAAYTPTGPARYTPPASPVRTAPVSGPAEGEALRVVRKTASSGLYLTAVIAYSIGLILSAISAFTMKPRDMLLYDVLDMDKTMFYVTNIVGLIPTILMTLGMWLFFGACVSRGSRVSTAGLSIIKVMLIITQVILAIIMGLIVIAIIIAMIASGGLLRDIGLGDLARDGTGIMIVVLLVIALVYTLITVFIAKAVRTINTVKTTVAYGRPSADVSPFVAVMCIIGCVAMTVLVVLNLINNNILSAFSTLLTLVTTLCFAILIFRYRSAMNGLTYSGGYSSYSEY